MAGTSRCETERPDFWEATSDQIGPITSIELRASQGRFDNVTIHVAQIPEPGTLAMTASGLLLAGAWVLQRRRSA